MDPAHQHPGTEASTEDGTSGGTGVRAVVGAFLGGATRPSVPALVGTVLVATVLFVTCVFAVTPDRLAGVHPGYLMNDPFDDFAKLTIEVFRTRRQGVEPGTLIVLQNSALQHALDDAEVLGELIAEDLGAPMPVVYLCAPGMSLLESLGVLAEIGPIPDAIVAVSVTPILFSRDPERYVQFQDRPRLGFRSSVIDEEMIRWGHPRQRRTGNYFLDNSAFFTARIGSLKNLVLGPRGTGRMHDLRPQLPDAGRWERMITFLNEFLEGYDPHHEANLSIMGRLIEIARANGARSVVLVEQPINPSALAELDAVVFDRYRREILRFAEDQGVEYREIQPEAAVDPDDFVDWVHIRQSGTRDRFTQVFARVIAEIAREKGERP